MATNDSGGQVNRGPCYCNARKKRRVERVSLSVRWTLFKWQVAAFFGRGPLAQSKEPPRGFCGWCEVCGRPGHGRHAPAEPRTGAWCDQHWDEMIRSIRI
jgi:hypothetical protein